MYPYISISVFVLRAVENAKYNKPSNKIHRYALQIEVYIYITYFIYIIHTIVYIYIFMPLYIVYSLIIIYILIYILCNIHVRFIDNVVDSTLGFLLGGDRSSCLMLHLPKVAGSSLPVLAICPMKNDVPTDPLPYGSLCILAIQRTPCL